MVTQEQKQRIIEQAIQYLPEPYRSEVIGERAKGNTYKITPNNTLEDYLNNSEMIVGYSHDHDKSAEGYKYWDTVYEMFFNKEIELLDKPVTSIIELW